MSPQYIHKTNENAGLDADAEIQALEGGYQNCGLSILR